MTRTADEHRAELDARYPTWTPYTTAQFLDVVAERYPTRPLVLTDDGADGGAHTYREMSEWSRRLAAGLIALGVRAGDHVAVDLANSPEVVALKFAVARVGAVSVSINFLLRHEELHYILRQSDATVLITMDRFRDLDYLDCLDRIIPGWEGRGVETRAGGSVLPRLRQVYVHGMEARAARGRPLDDLVELGRAVEDAEVDARCAAVDPGSVSDLLYTSGTTGAAKGVLLRHDAVLRTGYSCAYTRALPDARRSLFALPIYHVFGYVEGLIASLFVGGAIRAHATFDAAAMLRDVERHGIHELICVPAMTSVVLDAARAGRHDLSSLRTMFSSGAAHAPDMWDRMVELLGVEEIFTAYGQTETTASTTCTRPGDPLKRLATTNGTLKPAGAAGDPALGGTLAVYKTVHAGTGEDLPPGETGELVVRGPIITTGYYDKPVETAAAFTPDGWLRTGDLGHLDRDGYLVLTGRTKESYRCGGELVIPGEVELVLADHPDVASAHVVGIPHPRMGEVGCAWVVPRAAPPDPAELIAYCASRLGRFKVPASVLFTEADQLPITATGRVRKFTLVERAVAALSGAEPSHRTGQPSTTGSPLLPHT
jgi:fatty-acyl-CoA synthase